MNPGSLAGIHLCVPTTHEVCSRLASLGISLPAAPPKPGGLYTPVQVRHDVAYVACQFAIAEGKPAFVGRIGSDLTTAQGVEAARLAAVNVLAQLHGSIGFERIEGLCRFEMYIQAADGWDEMPAVLDGASRLFLDALGPEVGAHSRAPIGVARLPWNMPVELVTTFALRRA